MKPEVATRRIKTFGERFGEAHLYLAYHAAFPLALTPDLLYRMWANFQRDINGEALNIPWMAVADLLLSSLCDEVGHELYEMDTAVRNALLKELKENSRFGNKRINELSDFLLAYVQQQLESHDPDMRDFAQTQRWTALAYVRPSEAAQEIASTLARLKLEEKREWVRMALLVETFAEPLVEFQPLLIYARGMQNFARGNLESAVAEFGNLSGDRNYLYFAGVNLPIPEQISNKKKSTNYTASAIPEQRLSPTTIPAVNKFSIKGQGGSKLVVFSLLGGDLNQGFPVVTAQLWHNNQLFKITGSLPAVPELSELYRRWKLLYEAVHQRLGSNQRIKVHPQDITNISVNDFDEVCHQLQTHINAWLKSESFQNLERKLRTLLSRDDEIRVIIETNITLLHRLPWHLWDFFEDYPLAELALSNHEYASPQVVRKSSTGQVKILAILGNSFGIDIDKNHALLQALTDTQTRFLVEPTRKQLDEQLWNQNWDILFFAGHSASIADGEIGEIYINQTQSLTISQFKNALKAAITRGLKLAIFNSDDGIGLARNLGDLNIPQMIVMREGVPNLVAQEFLKNFLVAFASGQSFYLAVREARERLQWLENDFPCASWLPVIYQNPTTFPITWQELLGRYTMANTIPKSQNWIQRLFRRRR